MTPSQETAGGKLRVVVVDDSSFNRKAIKEILESHPEISVVSTAVDGEQGLKVVTVEKPDLITLDLEMPRMDGFTFLRVIMSQQPTPVIVISSHSRKQEVFQALELGALDFVAKPDRFFTKDVEALRDEIIGKALAVRLLQVVPFSQKGAAPRSLSDGAEASAAATAPEAATSLAPPRVVCVGASTGGPPALQALFSAIGSGGETAFLVAQHMPEKFTQAFAERLERRASLRISEATDDERLERGHVYVAPGGLHLEVRRIEGECRTRLVRAAPQDHYIPSVDRLFASVAREFTGEMLAVVLTGMGSDGSQGVRAFHEAGGQVLAESKESAIVYGMPKEAAATGCVSHVLPLGELIERIHRFAFAARPTSGKMT